MNALSTRILILYPEVEKIKFPRDNILRRLARVSALFTKLSITHHPLKVVKNDPLWMEVTEVNKPLQLCESLGANIPVPTGGVKN